MAPQPVEVLGAGVEIVGAGLVVEVVGARRGLVAGVGCLDLDSHAGLDDAETLLRSRIS